jgi:tetratricopeptide (TPR) repeat protein
VTYTANTPETVAARALNCCAEYARSRQLVDIVRGIALFEQALEDPRCGALRARVQGNRATALKELYLANDNLRTLSASIEAHREAAADTDLAAIDQASWSYDLSRSLRTRFGVTGQAEDLDEAITVGRVARSSRWRPAPDLWADWLSSWASDLEHRHQARERQTGTVEEADIEEAVDLRKAALAAASQRHPDPSGLSSNIGYACSLHARAVIHREPVRAAAMAREALQHQLRALACMPAQHPHAARIRGNFSLALMDVTACTGQPDVAAHAETLSSLRDGNDIAASLELAVLLRNQYQHGGREADLQDATNLARWALDEACARQRGAAMRTLGVCLMLGARVPGDYTRGVALLRSAVEHYEREGESMWALRTRGDLAAALQERFDFLRDAADLSEGIELTREILTHDASLDPEAHRTALLRLGVALQIRYRSHGNPKDLDAAIDALDHAITLLSDPFDKRLGGALSSSGLAFHLRYEGRGNVADSARAITAGEAALRFTSEGDAALSRRLSNLGLMFRARGERSGAPADLDMAVKFGAQAVEVARDDESSASARLNLSKAVYARALLLESADELEGALQLARAVAHDPSAPCLTRFSAGALFGRWAANCGLWQEAAAGFACAMSNVEQVVWHGLSRAARETLLRQVHAVAALGGAAALEAQQPDLALQLLECGRGVFWAQQLRLREPIQKIRERAPELAEEFVSLSAGLNAAPDDLQVASTPRLREGIAALAAHWDDTVVQIRRLPGLQNFLRPLELDELLECAAETPVVVINVSPYRCDAVLLTTTGIHVVPLVGLTLERVKAIADAHAENLETFDYGRQAEQTALAEMALTERLVWLRREITDPILDALERLGLPLCKGEPLRVRWCPTGPLAMLPLHAAAHARVTSSYALTVSSLAAVQRRVRNADGEVRLLVVAVPESPGMPKLEAVFAESAALRARLPASTFRLGEAATRRQIVSDLEQHTHVHFACHGSAQDLANPSAASLHLSDAALSMFEIAALRLRGELAFLSACGTAKCTTELPDEAIHVTAALQAAGYRHVIGTLWSIPDPIGPEVTEAVYQVLAPAGVLRAENAASAVHAAVSLLRRKYEARPSIWAAYAHFGP